MTCLPDHIRPDRPLICHRCDGTGREPYMGADGKRSFVFSGPCVSCMGSGDLLCIDYAKPGCTGYAIHSYKEVGHDDTCAFHTTHCGCGAAYVVLPDDVFCPDCSPKGSASWAVLVGRASA